MKSNIAGHRSVASNLFSSILLCMLAVPIARGADSRQPATTQTSSIKPAPYVLNDDPFVPLVEEIDRGKSPEIIAAPVVNILDNKGNVTKTIAGGTEVVSVKIASAGKGLERSVRVSHVTFKSVPVYKDESYHDDTMIYAQIALPDDAKAGERLPGILLLHGGGGYAQNATAYSQLLNWAAAGYVAVACDLPGIAGDAANVSSGAWRGVSYSQLPRFTVMPDIKASWIYTADATALKAFALLRAQPNVDRSKIGVVGISWGGYATTMVCGILGDRVTAGFSIFGSGFYDEESAFQPALLPETSAARFKNDPQGLKHWQTTGAGEWLTYLDAGRRAGNIKANFYLSAASNDHFFRPPAVTKTLEAITHAKSLSFQFSPNDNHTTTTPGGFKSDPQNPNRSWCKMEEAFFDYYLKSVGAPLPAIKVEGAPRSDAQNNLEIQFSVTSDPSLNVLPPQLYYSTTDKPWKERKWIKLDAALRETGVAGPVHSYVIVMPQTIAAQKVNWYLLVSDKTGDRQTTVSTQIFTAGDEK